MDDTTSNILIFLVCLTLVASILAFLNPWGWGVNDIKELTPIEKTREYTETVKKDLADLKVKQIKKHQDIMLSLIKSRAILNDIDKQIHTFKIIDIYLKKKAVKKHLTQSSKKIK